MADVFDLERDVAVVMRCGAVVYVFTSRGSETMTEDEVAYREYCTLVSRDEGRLTIVSKTLDDDFEHLCSVRQLEGWFYQQEGAQFPGYEAGIHVLQDYVTSLISSMRARLADYKQL